MATVLIVTTDQTFGRLLERNLAGRHYKTGLRLLDAPRESGPRAPLPVDKDGLVILDLPAQPTHPHAASPFAWRGVTPAQEAHYPLLVLADRSWSASQVRQFTPSRTLTKPFPMEDLVAAVRDLVGPPSSSL